MVQKQRKSMTDILAAAARKQLNTPVYDEAVESIERITQAKAVLEKREKQSLSDVVIHADSKQNQSDTDSPPQDTQSTPPVDTPPKKQRTNAPKNPTAPPRKEPRGTRKSTRPLLDESLKNFLPQKPKILGEQQVRLYEWLKGQGGRVYATGNVISVLTGIPLRSLRRIFQRWEELGVFEKQAGAHGTVLVLLLDDAQAYGTKGSRAALSDHTNGTTDFDAAGEDSLTDAPRARIPYEELYPLITAAGFGPQQFRNAVEAAKQAGLETEPFTKYLIYAEYELEHDCMVDAKGELVTNPQNWIFKCLRSGSYRVPKGYLSPLEAQRRALEEALRVEREEHRKLEALQAQQLELALEKETDRLTRLVLDIDDDFSRQVLDRLPPFLHKLDRESPVYFSGIRREIRVMLTEQKVRLAAC